MVYQWYGFILPIRSLAVWSAAPQTEGMQSCSFAYLCDPSGNNSWHRNEYVTKFRGLNGPAHCSCCLLMTSQWISKVTVGGVALYVGTHLCEGLLWQCLTTTLQNGNWQSVSSLTEGMMIAFRNQATKPTFCCSITFHQHQTCAVFNKHPNLLPTHHQESHSSTVTP